MSSYTTKAGDTWDMIAKEVYGKETYTSFLMENNRDKIGYFVFPRGVTLKVLDLPDMEDSTLPEWRS